MEIEEKKPWISFFERLGLPTTQSYPEIPVFEYLDRVAKDTPKTTAITQFGREMSYGELKEKVDRLATALADLGVKKGDRVAVMLPTSAQFVISDFAILKAGGVSTPCSFLHPAAELKRQFTTANIKKLICIDTALEQVKELKEMVGLEDVIVMKLDDFSSREKNVVHERLGDGYHWLTDLINKYPPNPPKVDIDPKKDLAVLIFTGGTTGVPKGVMISHYGALVDLYQAVGLFGGITNILDLIKGLGLPLLFCFPMHHVLGHFAMYAMIFLGSNSILATDPRDAKDMVQLIREYRPLAMLTVPTQDMRILEEIRRQKATDVHIFGGGGSAHLPPELQEDYEREGVGYVMEGYGLSEVHTVSHGNISPLLRLLGGEEGVRGAIRLLRFLNDVMGRPGVYSTLRPIVKIVANMRIIPWKRLGLMVENLIPKLFSAMSGEAAKKQEIRGSIGVPLIDTDCRVVDLETGEDIPWDKLIKGEKTGELLIKGPQVMVGYWPEPGSGLDNGWLHTGDVVKVNENGFFSVVDRTKDMVNVSGVKVYTAEVDNLLYRHPSVEMAATIGVPDPKVPGSEIVKSFIVLKSGYEGKVTEEEIKDLVRKNMPSTAVPKSVEFIKEEELPLTPTEKIFKRKLREREIEKMKKAGILK